MTENDPIVIIGAGQAGVQVADSLRSEGYRGPVVVLNDEKDLPYQRPQLSKDFLFHATDSEMLPLRGEGFYRENQIELRYNARVRTLLPADRSVLFEDGSQLDYSQLVIATGTRARELNIPGSQLTGVHQLRTLDDARELKANLRLARRLVVIGAGFIGLEVAAAAIEMGIEVTILPGDQAPMARSVSPVISQWFQSHHLSTGVHLMENESACAFDGTGSHVEAVIGSSGRHYPADLVVVGIGAIPNVEAFEDTGLEIDNGICVDEYLHTGLAGIWALGDCASIRSRDRIESVQNATDQGRLLARNLVAASKGHLLEEYTALPWFWSHQGTAKLQIAGLQTQVCGAPMILGHPEKGKYSVLNFNQFDELVVVESVNSPADHMAARKILSQPFPLSREVAESQDFALKAHSRAVSVTS